jgi:hypothetical protein
MHERFRSVQCFQLSRGRIAVDRANYRCLTHKNCTRIHNIMLYLQSTTADTGEHQDIANLQLPQHYVPHCVLYSNYDIAPVN